MRLCAFNWSVRALWKSHYRETDQFVLTTCSKSAYSCGKRLLLLSSFEREPKQVPHFFKISYQSLRCCVPRAWWTRCEKEQVNFNTYLHRSWTYTSNRIQFYLYNFLKKFIPFEECMKNNSEFIWNCNIGGRSWSRSFSSWLPYISKTIKM